MQNGLSVDVEDWFQVGAFERTINRADWGSLETDPDDGIDISADGRVATRSFTPELDADGWFSHTWCVAEGDPAGAHSIELTIDGKSLTRFDFTTVLPEDYQWPAILQPQPHERSVDHSW